MLRVLLLPLLAVAGGVGGFFLRRWELSTAFEASGLAIPGAPATVVLIVWSVVFALALALLCRGAKNELKDYGGSFSARGNWAYLVVTALAAACLLVAGFFGLTDELGGLEAPHLLRMLLWVMCILSFFCVLTVILNNFRGGGRKYSLALLVPAYTCCLWLVAAYQQRSADPVVLDYVYGLFAIICTLLGLYFTAGFSFERAKVWRCAFFCLLSVCFSIVTLADGHDRSTRLLFLFSILYQLATVSVLLYHAFVKAPEPSPDESNKTQEVTPDE